jgi:hypothetical protein
MAGSGSGTIGGVPAATQNRSLNSQPFATASAAAFEDQAPAAGAHPFAKAVIAFSFGIFGLICALHDYLSIIVISAV